MLQDAEPRSCLAVRLARTHNGGHGDDALLSCELCGKAAQDVMCEPLLVGGEVIGSLLVEHVEPLDEISRRRIAESVSQAAPVIANLRNLARAESRAATDALTGLPNRRSMNESLKRLSAQAARSGLPLAALAIDLDHFKQVNDRWGHDRGDQALASVGALLGSTVRESDVAGRIGWRGVRRACSRHRAGGRGGARRQPASGDRSDGGLGRPRRVLGEHRRGRDARRRGNAGGADAPG